MQQEFKAPAESLVSNWTIRAVNCAWFRRRPTSIAGSMDRTPRRHSISLPATSITAIAPTSLDVKPAVRRIRTITLLKWHWVGCRSSACTFAADTFANWDRPHPSMSKPWVLDLAKAETAMNALKTQGSTWQSGPASSNDGESLVLYPCIGKYSRRLLTCSWDDLNLVLHDASCSYVKIVGHHLVHEIGRQVDCILQALLTQSVQQQAGLNLPLLDWVPPCEPVASFILVISWCKPTGCALRDVWLLKTCLGPMSCRQDTSQHWGNWLKSLSIVGSMDNVYFSLFQQLTCLCCIVTLSGWYLALAAASQTCQ